MESPCSMSAALATLTVQVCFPDARATVLENLNCQREEGLLCDLSVQVQGQVFKAHRCVLAASSPYFHDQVLLKNVTTVSLPSILDPVAFEGVLSSAYTGQLSIVHDDIVNYITVASFLQMWHIVDKCTEILKRPQPVGEAPPCNATVGQQGTVSRQQSPSSTECLNLEKEGRWREKKPDALPPLASWRRPQQFPRWGNPRHSSPQHLADTQFDPSLPSSMETGYLSGEEMWISSNAKTSHLGHAVAEHNSCQHRGIPTGKTSRQRARLQQWRAPPGIDRLLNKNRGNRDNDETQERRKSDERETKNDVDEEVVDKEGLRKTEHCGNDARDSLLKDKPCSIGSQDEKPEPGNQDITTHQSADAVTTPVTSLDMIKEEKQRNPVGSDQSLNVSGVPVCLTDGDSCPSGPNSARKRWQSGSWSQGDHVLPEMAGDGYSRDEDVDEEEEEDVDFNCFTVGPLSRGTCEEMTDGPGQVPQKPAVTASPDFSLTDSEMHWSSPSAVQGGSLTPPTSSQHLSPSSTACPPHSSPTAPSSSSSSLAGKVHFCHCGKAYTVKSMLYRHVKMQHLNLRPFDCPVCTKSFKMKHHLTKHLKTHGGLRPYECGVCGKKVMWRDSFLRHQARCERLASSSSANGGSSKEPASDKGGAYSFGFEEGEAFTATVGQVKVEEVDFTDGMEEDISGMLGNMSRMVDEIRKPSQTLNTGCHVFKKESL